MRNQDRGSRAFSYALRITRYAFLLQCHKALGVVPLPEFRAVHLALVDDDEAVGVDRDGEALERAGRGALEVDAVHVVAGPVARALELVLARQPVGDAAQVRADGVDGD